MDNRPPPPPRKYAKLLVFQERRSPYGDLIEYECANEPGLLVSEEQLRRPQDSLLDVDPVLLRCLTEFLDELDAGW